MLQEPDQPLLADRIEEAPNVCVENPVHPGTLDRHRQCIQRVMRAACGPKPVREAEEVFLIDRVEHRDDRALDNLVFQRRDTQRPLPAIGLRYEPPPDGQCPIRAAMDPSMQVVEVALQACLVVLPRHSIHTGCGTALERQERVPQQVGRDMVQQRGEPLLLPLPCSLPYAVQPL